MYVRLFIRRNLNVNTLALFSASSSLVAPPENIEYFLPFYNEFCVCVSYADVLFLLKALIVPAVSKNEGIYDRPRNCFLLLCMSAALICNF